MDSAEARLAAIGWPVEEEDFGRADEPDVQGCLLIEEVEGGVRARIVVRPRLQPAFNPPSRRCAKVIR
jgi:hypothetical protein